MPELLCLKHLYIRWNFQDAIWWVQRSVSFIPTLWLQYRVYVFYLRNLKTTLSWQTLCFTDTYCWDLQYKQFHFIVFDTLEKLIRFMLKAGWLLFKVSYKNQCCIKPMKKTLSPHCVPLVLGKKIALTKLKKMFVYETLTVFSEVMRERNGLDDPHIKEHSAHIVLVTPLVCIAWAALGLKS